MFINSFAMQEDKNVFPSPVLPVNNKFFSLESSKLSINFFEILTICLMFSLGEIFNLYFSLLISSEYTL